MKHYVGVKVVQAEPCDEPKPILPQSFDPLGTRDPRPGYRVRYEDGYTSWSPREAFEAAYVEMPNVATAASYRDSFLGEMQRWRAAPPVNEEAQENKPGRIRFQPAPPVLSPDDRARALDLAISSFPSGIPPKTADITDRAAAFASFMSGMVTLDEPKLTHDDVRRIMRDFTTGGIATQRSNVRSEAAAEPPRVTESDIEANIAYEVSFVALDAIDDMIQRGRGVRPPNYQARQTLRIITLCLMVLRNGFKIVGTSAPVSEENFDPDLGRKFAREDALRQIGPFMGYALRDRLAAGPAKA
jgi:hypothetical protein